MNSSYNYIKRLVDSNNIITSTNGSLHRQDEKYETNQLDGEQRHTRFDYYEYNVLKFGTPSWLDQYRINFQEHLEDLDHDQARHQGVHGHGRSETYYNRRHPPANSLNLALCKYICAIWP